VWSRSTDLIMTVVVLTSTPVTLPFGRATFPTSSAMNTSPAITTMGVVLVN
jgi:hypothetical protein